jgi:hypothetical protein
MNDPEGKKTTIRRYLGPTTVLCRATVCFGVSFECLRLGSTVVEHSNSDLKDEGLNPGTDIRKIIYKVLRIRCLMFFYHKSIFQIKTKLQQNCFITL